MRRREAGVMVCVPGLQVGEHYLADGWTQRLMTLSDFITRHVEGGCGDGERAYLAQHPLFDQVALPPPQPPIPGPCFPDHSNSRIHQ